VFSRLAFNPFMLLNVVYIVNFYGRCLEAFKTCAYLMVHKTKDPLDLMKMSLAHLVLLHENPARILRQSESNKCRATISVTKGSFFDKSHLLLTKLCDLLYYWSIDLSMAETQFQV